MVTREVLAYDIFPQSPLGRSLSFRARDGLAGAASNATATSTVIETKASLSPKKLPATGIACRMSRATATGIRWAADAAVGRIEADPTRARDEDVAPGVG